MTSRCPWTTRWASALALGAAALAQEPILTSGGVLLPEQAAYDVTHYDLAIEVRPASRSIDAVLTLTATWVADAPTFLLDLDDPLVVHSVTSDGEPVSFAREPGRIRLTPHASWRRGESFRVAIAYGGEPREAKRPPWDGGFTWRRTRDGQPWIATTCQMQGADLWWPCKDHPSDKPDGFDLHVTVPKGLVCASNGVLVRTEEREDRTVFHWQVRNPIQNYGIALNIGPYVVIEERYESVAGDQVPVFFWVLPENEAKGRERLPEFLAHLRFFEERFGPYGFRNEKYGVVETPHLGMEHQTIIAYGYRYRLDDRFQYDWLHHHEASHEWWANLVTARDWADFWIHEGFGTYSQALYIEQLRGRPAYVSEMRRRREAIHNLAPIAPRGVHSTADMYFRAGTKLADNDIYYKGSWVLHTLRWLIGEEALFLAMRRMAYPTKESETVLDGSQVRFRSTEDFVALCEEHAGRELDWFFEVYVRRAPLPRLEHEVVDGTLHLRWITADDLPFPMPVEVALGEERVRVAMDGGRGSLEVGDAAFRIDPDHWLLRAEEE